MPTTFTTSGVRPFGTQASARVSAQRKTGFVRSVAAGLFAAIALMWRVQRERNQLRNLDERMLKDMGLSQDKVTRESERAFFDIPANRRDEIWR